MDDRKCNLDFDFTPIGQAIKKARNTEHMTRESLAELLDYSVRHVQSIENDGQFPSIQLLFFLARRFHISLDQFLFPEEKTVKKTAVAWLGCLPCSSGSCCGYYFIRFLNIRR